MPGPKSVHLFVTGILNGLKFAARGTLRVDETTGTKFGTITYQPLPKGLAPGPDCTIFSTGRCFVGAKHVGEGRFVGPLELLGREFESVRLTTVGQYGTVSVAERASHAGGALSSELTAVGEVKVPQVWGVGPLRELIAVSEPDTLVSEGRYSLLTAKRGTIPLRYAHFYRSLKPERGLFRRLRGHVFLLRANISTRIRGRSVEYRSRSTIRRQRPPES